jgi:hypothetical protein
LSWRSVGVVCSHERSLISVKLLFLSHRFLGEVYRRYSVQVLLAQSSQDALSILLLCLVGLPWLDPHEGSPWVSLARTPTHHDLPSLSGTVDVVHLGGAAPHVGSIHRVPSIVVLVLALTQSNSLCLQCLLRVFPVQFAFLVILNRVAFTISAHSVHGAIIWLRLVLVIEMAHRTKVEIHCLVRQIEGRERVIRL